MFSFDLCVNRSSFLLAFCNFWTASFCVLPMDSISSREMKSVESVSVNEEEIEDFSSSVVVMKSYFACFLFRGVSVCQCGLYYMCGLIMVE